MLFNGSDTPQVYGTPLGADFPRALVETLVDAYEDQPPEALARLRLVVNTARMARRITELFDAHGARLLPRISLVSDLTVFGPRPGAPTAHSKLRTQLELSTLIRHFAEAERAKQTDLAPIGSVFDLAVSLTALMNEMDEENVPPRSVAELDISDQSGHWQRTQDFLDIVTGYEAARGGVTEAARQRFVLEALISNWHVSPPRDPILIAGSTGSRGLTQMLMQAVCRLPHGAVVLPGFDFGFAARAWPALPDGAMSEDHPQYRFHAFLSALGLGPDAVRPLPDGAPPSPARNTLVSLALRPAPVTDQWLAEGRETALIAAEATKDITLLEAQTQREEALAIALRLRQAAEDGTDAALITPDRTLTRQVTAALARWGIRPDDSAGEPLHLTPVGRLLRQSAALLAPEPLSSEALVALLKHPRCNMLETRGTHLRYTREFELYLRRKGLPTPSAEALEAWSAKHKDNAARDWAAWVAETFLRAGITGAAPLDRLIERHIESTEAIARGPATEAAPLWSNDGGEEARTLLQELAECSDAAGQLDWSDYANLLDTSLSSGELRPEVGAHPHIRIWGTLEARVQGVKLMILAGLNEGSWPEAPAPDPWLNRAMRAELGLLLPERRIGLSAHDFQQAIAAPEVWLTRAQKSGDAETIPSRWLSRLTNLLNGLPEKRGKDALRQMRARAKGWLARAAAVEAPRQSVSPAPRPAPLPPVAARPQSLSLTEIQKLVRDPYGIYARRVLGLEPLGPLQKLPDALLRGTVLHTVMEEFVPAAAKGDVPLTRDALVATARTVLEREVPWPAARLMWLAQFERAADTLIEEEAERQATDTPLAFETKGAYEFADLGFTLRGKADRFDALPDGSLAIYDYKTGKPPTRKQRNAFDQQLPLTALLASEGAFTGVPAARAGKLAHIGIGSNAGESALDADELDLAQTAERFRALISAFAQPSKGYPSRRAVHDLGYDGDYDHLARYGEWTDTDDPVEVPLT